jgi:hypothetical protein
MNLIKARFLAVAALIAGALPAHAFAKPDFNAAPPIPHVRESQLADTQPQVMNYTDQMAQSLGVKNGGWEAFQSRDPLLPSVKGGIDGGAPMLKLQWRP